MYTFTDDHGSFRAESPEETSRLYFPLVNEAGFLASITPGLQGDIALDYHTFLTIPLCTEDLHLSRSSFNMWVSVPKGKDRVYWSTTGRSAWQRALPPEQETVQLEVGQLWHKVTRLNKTLGLEASVLNFVPSHRVFFEIMMVEVKNISKKPIKIQMTSAIPLHGRSADNLRDHRHVTSLLNRLYKEPHGLQLCPTMSFNERGHLVNNTACYVVGVDQKGAGPAGFFPTMASFIGEGGDLERPKALIKAFKPQTALKDLDQGREAVGALQFKPVTIAPQKSAHVILFLGIDRERVNDHRAVISTYGTKAAVLKTLEDTKNNWRQKQEQLVFQTGNIHFNRWMKWVGAQPTFRKIYGNSFLPDFDYGKGGRGWRDLWQDCLALLLANPDEVRADMLRNFGGVRMDGSNATIIARKQVETRAGIKWEPVFIADRNNIVRTWMDHGIWPTVTAELYLHQTGDWDFLFETAPYFKDGQLHRGKKKDAELLGQAAVEHPTKTGGAHRGTVLEHMLVQTLVPFFNVGDHNNIRLEDADWNDGLDMAGEKGESVAFTALYAGNLEGIARLLEAVRNKTARAKIEVAGELALLLDRIGQKLDYADIAAKRARLEDYFDAVQGPLSGEKISISLDDAINDLRDKAAFIKAHLNRHEWIETKDDGWFNGYYDNEGRRVEGPQVDGCFRMTLTGQVFPVMAQLASPERVEKIIKTVKKRLYDESILGYRLNTDFKTIQPNLGRAFSFAYGEKENGAVFSHMAVMYANALYRAGFAEAGHHVLSSLYRMATHLKRSRIYPGLPEYFNSEGRGLYHFLTGSASWYVFTLLTRVFGVRGEAGDLVLNPMLMPEQFDRKGEASVDTAFAGARLRVIYVNPTRKPPTDIEIKSIQHSGEDVPFTRRGAAEAVIKRKVLEQNSEWRLKVVLS